ncbi:MAG: hypothetical protein EKK40_11650 [Bradyrhizobiaceae bacterium]|nr:MAG: hypothetical protein EKK40_11650 [Bradyrhizobiaceae bacterium]
MKFLLSILVGIAVFGGYKGWPLYSILPAGGALVIWNLMYFGIRGMHVATGGPLAYLLRLSVINIFQAAAFYGAGRGLSYLIG